MHVLFSFRTRYFIAIYCKIIEINAQIWHSYRHGIFFFFAHNVHNYTVQSGSEHLAQLYHVRLSKHLSSNLSNNPTK